MSKKEDDDKAKMSQCEKKSVVVQGIKDRSEIRKHKVTEKQGFGDEGETREAREGKQGKTRRWVSMVRREDGEHMVQDKRACGNQYERGN